ncbi:MAG: class I SAM-dependent methyltransferase [Thermodesulfobacteriota bacterium]
MICNLNLRYRFQISKYREQFITLYHWYKRIAYPSVRIAFEKNQLLKKSNDYTAKDMELLRRVSINISPCDTMHAGDTRKYFNVGLSAIHCIDDVLSNISQTPSIGTILDLPSGHGRVLRFLVQRFPQAEITACEIDKKAVDYCIKHFGVRGVYSSHDLRNMSLDRQYDLIWCGSLITHMNASVINDLLAFFYRHIASNGILIFTTHGSLIADRIKKNSFDLKVTREGAPTLLSSFQQNGFAYMEYPWKDANYGISLTSTEWIKEQLAKFKDLRICYFGEHKWDSWQDVYGVIKVN